MQCLTRRNIKSINNDGSFSQFFLKKEKYLDQIVNSEVIQQTENIIQGKRNYVSQLCYKKTKRNRKKRFMWGDLLEFIYGF